MSYRDDDSAAESGGGGGGKKRVWTTEEDELLKAAVAKYGERAWSRIADELPGRIGKQCRDRWCNHLSPDLDKKKWTEEDDEKLFDAVNRLGNQWAEISRRVLPGRSDLSIKNRYYSRLRREHRRAESMGFSIPKELEKQVVSPRKNALPPDALLEDAIAGIQASDGPIKKKVKLSNSEKKSAAKMKNGKRKVTASTKRAVNVNSSSIPVPPLPRPLKSVISGSNSTIFNAMQLPPMPPFEMFGSKMVGSTPNPSMNGLPMPNLPQSGDSGSPAESNPANLTSFFSAHNPYQWNMPPSFPGSSSMIFPHPYSPITSLSTTPVPSPPRSPASHPVSMSVPAGLPPFASLGPNAAVSNTNSNSVPTGTATTSTNSGTTNADSTSRPTSPTFPIPGPSPALGPPIFSNINFWPYVSGPPSNQMNDSSNSLPTSGGTSPIPSSFGTAGTSLLNAASKDGGGAHSSSSGPDAQASDLFNSMTTFSRLFAPRGTSPSSSPTNGPLSLPPSNKAGTSLAQHTEWFPTIGSRGLEYRQHFRPIYGQADALFNELPPAATNVRLAHANGGSLMGTIANTLTNMATTMKKRTKKTSKDGGPNTGRWTAEEQKRFEEAIAKFGTSDWTSVTEYVKSRTVTQVRSHAQKYFMKRDPAKAAAVAAAVAAEGGSIITGGSETSPSAGTSGLDSREVSDNEQATNEQEDDGEADEEIQDVSNAASMNMGILAAASEMQQQAN